MSVLLLVAALAGLPWLATRGAPMPPVPAGEAPRLAVDAHEPAGVFPRGRELLIQDAELVHGPADRGFDPGLFIGAHRDALPTSPDLEALVSRTALQHSLSPRLLLALLSVVPVPSGATTETHLVQMAAWLADGYYGLKYRGERIVQFADDSRISASVQGGAGHFAVARLLARSSTPEDWAAWRQRFAERYETWFGPATWQPSPVSPELRQPPLLLPWPAEQTWYYTGGPHGAWGVASAWGAVDFAPPSRVGCDVAPEWVLSAAPGRVLHAADGLVLQDLDGDADLRTGWVLAYLHVATRDRVAVGTVLDASTPIGHPSCEGGVADGAHVHLARRFNGEWLPVDGGPAPLILSGWGFRSLGGEYDGAMEHGELGTRMAVTSRRGGDSAVVSDNGALRRAQLAPQWADAGVSGIGPGGVAITYDAAEAPSTGRALPTAVDAAAVGNARPVQDATTGSAAGAKLGLRVSLAGRSSAATPITVHIRQSDRPVASVTSQLDAWGQSPPLALPDGMEGAIDIEVIVPGFLPLSAMGIVIQGAMTTVDLSANGQLLAQPGDVDGDARIDTGDLTAWWSARSDGSAAADLTGDGSANLVDLWQVLGSLAGR